MFVRNQGKYIQEMKLEIGNLLGEEKNDEVYVVLREPKTEWMLKFTKCGEDDTTEQIAVFKELLPKIILKHNLTEDGEKLLSVDEVTEVLFDSLETTQYIMQEYFSAPFFTQQKRTESQLRASALTSSKAEG